MEHSTALSVQSSNGYTAELCDIAFYWPRIMPYFWQQAPIMPAMQFGWLVRDSDGSSCGAVWQDLHAEPRITHIAFSTGLIGKASILNAVLDQLGSCELAAPTDRKAAGAFLQRYVGFEPNGSYNESWQRLTRESVTWDSLATQ